TFGLAIAEFSLRNKPVLTYALSGERNHIDVLGARGRYYAGPRGLRDLLLGFDRAWSAHQDWDCYSRDFSPSAVMPLFDQHFIRKAQTTGIGDADWSLAAGDRFAILGNRLRIRGIKSLRSWARLVA
ncbi:MAG TPA: hypothetical protein VFM34_00745, partial [Moraxellaceae bacterium]|nr:hypothetical protein [Moraxellaceae bacterium]